MALLKEGASNLSGVVETNPGPPMDLGPEEKLQAWRDCAPNLDITDANTLLAGKVTVALFEEIRSSSSAIESLLQDLGLSPGARAFLRSKAEATPAGNVRGSVSGVGSGTEILDKLQEIQLEIKKTSKAVEATISNASSGVVEAVLSTVGIASCLEGELPAHVTSVPFTPFDWPHDDEVQDSAGACEHLQRLLKDAGLSLNKRNGWKVLDIRKQQNFLGTQLGPSTVSGTADAVIVPYRVGDFPYLQTRVILYWKCPQNIRWEESKGQALLEFIGASVKSNAPVIGVVTDLQTQFHILKPKETDSGSTSYDGICIERLSLPPDLGMAVIKDFLATVSSSDGYVLEKDPQAPPPYARLAKRMKEAVPESASERLLELAEFLPMDERFGLMWDLMGQCQLELSRSENYSHMFA